jgi:hypothetical protein
MNKKRALLIAKVSTENRKSGISNRVEQISDFLNEMGFEVEISSNSGSSKSDYYDLICISSFSNASHILSARSRCDFLWFDAMDSWRLTRKTLFLHDPPKEFLKVLRDGFGRLFVRLPDLITYCSRRDSAADKSDKRKTLILGPVGNRGIEKKDFGRRYVFVGPSHYFPNQEAVRFLFKLARLGIFQETKLHLYGASDKYKDSHVDVYVHGLSVDSELYGVSDIHLVPIWKGAGIKYKTFTPLSLGIKVISTREGANGLNTNPSLIICNSKEDFLYALCTVEPVSAHPNKIVPLLEMDQREIVRVRIAERFNDFGKPNVG